MELWHGSASIVRTPALGLCRPTNDYGAGFYCTPSFDMACEWACRTQAEDGFANRYELETEGLRMLDLLDERYTVLNWIAILLEHRTFQPAFPIANEGSAYLREHFLIDVSAYDLVHGYRADDSYFSFARAFINNQISVAQLGCAMHLGKLGAQTALVSEKAFAAIRFVEVRRAPSSVYFDRRQQRDLKAREDFRQLRQTLDIKGLYIRDIVVQGIENDDERLHL